MKKEQKTFKDFIKFIDDCGYDEHPECGHMNIEQWASILGKWVEKGYMNNELEKFGYKKERGRRHK